MFDRIQCSLCAFLAVGLLPLATVVRAQQLTLCPASAADGWHLTTFAAGFPTESVYPSSAGPIGVAFTDAGTVIVTDLPGNVYVFPNDNDNQSAAGATVAQYYGGSNAVCMARVGSHFYMTNQAGSASLMEINANGTYKQTILSNLYHATGLAVNSKNGHLFLSFYDSSSLLEVDPIAKQAVTFLTLPYPDGDGLTTDGNTVYVESGNHILGYRISDKALIFDSGFILGADGCALGAGALTGSLLVNTNFGQVFQIDLSTEVITLLASGGTRGDFVFVDPNGSLLITQSDRLIRITPPAGSGFEQIASLSVTPASVPGSLKATGTLTLTSPAPSNLTVPLANTNSTATVPASVTVLAGKQSVSFPITTVAVTGNVTGSITATLNAVSKSAPMTVRPLGVKSLQLSAASVKGGHSVLGTVTLENAAAPGSITVSFASTNSAIVPAPGNITISFNVKTGQVTINTKAVSANQTVTISATANGITRSATLTVTP